MKRILIFLGVIVVIFSAVAILTNTQTNDGETVESVTPGELQSKIDNGGPVTVYFYSEDCTYCQQTTPVVVPMTEDMGIDLQIYDVKQYEQGWDDFEINGTPTIVHFENGEETARIEGYHEEDVFRQWFEEEVLHK